jgi:hypothetical protein
MTYGQGDTGASMATVASVAILSSLGLSYILDKYKDKNDKNLREELKDRVKEQLEDSKAKVTRLEQIQGRMGAQILTS